MAVRSARLAAEQIAEEILFPRALETEAAGLVPVDLLDTLARAGLYGMAGPPGLGGAELAPGEHLAVIETLASACLTTTFVWLQHHGAVLALASSTSSELCDRWLEPMCRGAIRAGGAFSGLRSRRGPTLLAAPAEGGWVLDGEAPWVSGWGRIGVVHVAAFEPPDTIVWGLLDATPSTSLQATALPLIALGATGTVSLRFREHVLAHERVTHLQSYAEWSARDGSGPALRVNGCLALGVARGALRLLGPSPLDDELAACRELLDVTDEGSVVAGRARASELALRASSMLLVEAGGRGVLRHHHAQRLARESLLLLAFAQTGAIRDAQRSLLSAGADAVSV